MAHDQLPERDSIDPAVCHGRPCIHGTRVLVVGVLDALAAGLTTPDIVEQYPTLVTEDVRAAAAYHAYRA